MCPKHEYVVCVSSRKRNLHGTFLIHLLSEENIGEAWWHARTHCSAVWLLAGLIVKFEHIHSTDHSQSGTVSEDQER